MVVIIFPIVVVRKSKKKKKLKKKSWIYDPIAKNRQRGNIFYSAWEAMFLNKYGVTGHLITIIMFVMFAASMKEYRRSK